MGRAKTPISMMTDSLNARMHPAAPRASSTVQRVPPDDFSWLRADNWSDILRSGAALPDPILAHIDAESRHFGEVMSSTLDVQETLRSEMQQRLDNTETFGHIHLAYQHALAGASWQRDGIVEYAILEVPGASHPQLLRRQVGDVAAQLLVDLNVEAMGKAYFCPGFSTHSMDHQWIAWSADESGSGRSIIRFRNQITGQDGCSVEDAYPVGTFSGDNCAFLYVRIDVQHRHHQLNLHRLGTDAASDVVMLREHDPSFRLTVQRTQSRAWLVGSSQGPDRSEITVFPANNPLARARQVVSREQQGHWHVDEGNNVLYALTDADGASDYKIMTACLDDSVPIVWRDLVPHRPGTTLVGYRIFKRHLVWLERSKGDTRVVILKLDDGDRRVIDFEGGPGALDLGPAHEFDTSHVRLIRSSMHIPDRTFDCDMDTGQLTLIRVRSVGAGFDEADYICRRTHATSRDGTQVPVSVLFHRRTRLDGTAPCLCYGYGAYGISLPAAFDPLRLSLVDRGWVIAIVHVRGGGENGAAWHHAGRAALKPNGIADFVAAVRHLVEDRWCAPKAVVSHGMSAGGTLVAGALNQAPELFAGVIAQAPFVDVLNTMMDTTLPLTSVEWQEWGNPGASDVEYNQTAAWSPYENILAQTYPPVLAIAALRDSQVTYWEAAKWIAKLRKHQKGDAPKLLDMRVDAGHAGSPGQHGKVADAALMYAFALKVTGNLA
ncbi:prolyl oligopeptidase family serine peptidase [Pigmentiphaga litoralis]|uniref:prolyl oligopeptidase family serine peptidase n=1 Tax=Pigmentiphaga litoralis TaxID=516702 RepID=UPI003B434596